MERVQLGKQCAKCRVFKEKRDFSTNTYGRGNHPCCLGCRQQVCACGCGQLTTGLIDQHTNQPAVMIRNHHLRIGDHQKKAGCGNQTTTARMKASVAKLGRKNPMYGNYEHLRKIASQPGKTNPMYGKKAPHGRGAWYIRKDNSKVWLRSSWEVKIAELLDQRNLTWSYETKRFDLGSETYSPDFWIEEYQCFWEIKGWFHEKHQTTVRLFRQLYPDISLVVVNQSVMKFFFQGNPRWLR